jgi:enoyl-CoA hydratase/carnithine racemase
MADIRRDEAGDITMLTIDRPAVRNALTLDTHAELERAIRSTSARCVVITGVDPAFCAGDDMNKVMASAAGRAAQSERRAVRLTPSAEALLMTDVPVIAAVNGPAIGWGMELAIMADIRVVSERATFGELFVTRGICCDVPGLGRLAQLVGRERAAELLFTGRVIDADEARRMGLVSRVVPHEELLPAALEIAESIAANPPLAVQRIKAGLRRALDPDWQTLGTWVSSSLAELFQTEDHKEAFASYREKRTPLYQGR